jgi:hypothetical protein
LLRQISREQRLRGYRRTAAHEEQLGFDFSCVFAISALALWCLRFIVSARPHITA